jgi:hypothetical protein
VKIYVAGRTTDLKTVAGLAESLENEGHEITFKWYDPDIGEIRTSELRSEDLELRDHPLGPSAAEIGSDGWLTEVIHKPTGVTEIGEASSKVAAHDVAVNRLRAKLNNGWSADPDKAATLAAREIQAVDDAEGLVLVWAPDLLGAAIETGSAIGTEKKIWVYRPGRDSVFWYLPNVKIVWSKTELIESVNADEVDELTRGW